MTADGETAEWDDWVAKEPLDTAPPPAALHWVAAQVGADPVGVEPLPGGLSSAVHRLTFTDHPATVLRRYTYTDWIEREPNIPHDEARNLAALGGLDLGITTPALVAADPDGEHCDVPALLMTEVAGVPEIDPADPTDWAQKLAACLAGIHEQPPIADLPRFRRWDSPDRPLPEWTSDPALWRAAIDRANVDLPAHPDAFLHRDYHPNNIHWIDDEVCAVVDWLSACTGPIAADLSHCRWNLAILASPTIADHFTEHYRSLTGYSEDVILYDLATVLSGPVGPFPTGAWNALGRADLTSDTVAPRIDEWLALLMER